MRKWKFERRANVSTLRRIANPIIFVILALAFCGILLAILGFNPFTVYVNMIADIFCKTGIEKSVVAAIPLIFTGLGVATSYRMNLNNIGGDGQYIFGSIFCIWFLIYGPAMPAVAKLICAFLLSMLGGALIALIAAIPKALWDVSETISTMMLNYIALYVLNYLMYGPWKEKGQMIAQTVQIKKKYWLPNLFGTKINSIVIIGIVLAAVLFFFHTKTTRGYELEVIRRSPRAAEYAGMNVKANILLVLGLSGAICGLAGFGQITGSLHRAQADMAGGAGYTGIVIAFLAGLNPFLAVVVALLFGALEFSSVSVQVMGVPSQIAETIQGAIMLFVIAGEFVKRYKLTRTGVKLERKEVEA